MRGVLLAILALLAGSACVGPPLAPAAAPSPPAPPSPPVPPSPAPSDPPAASLERVCTTHGVPPYIRFGCGDATLSFTGRGQRPEEVLDHALRLIYRFPGLERIRVLGFQSYTEGGPPHTLAQRRVETVAREMVRRGVDPDMIDTVLPGHRYYSTAGEPDPCPPIEEDEIGHPHRTLFFELRACRELGPDAPDGRRPGP